MCSSSRKIGPCKNSGPAERGREETPLSLNSPAFEELLVSPVGDSASDRGEGRPGGASEEGSLLELQSRAQEDG